MTSTRWWQYVVHLIGDDTQQDAAERAGFSKSNFTRWKGGAKPDPEFVVVLARAYGGNVLEALVESGLISEGEADLREVSVDGVALVRASNLQIANELVRRNSIDIAYSPVPTVFEPQLDRVVPLSEHNQPAAVDETDYLNSASRKSDDYGSVGIPND